MPETNLDQGAVALPKDTGLSFRGLWEVFTSPSAFFKKLVAEPKLLVPWILIGLLVLVFFALTANMIFDMQWQNPKFQERMQQSPGMTKDQMRAIVSTTTIIFGTIAMLLSPLLIAALALFWGNFVFGGQATFRKILSVTLYGEFLYVLGAMILNLPLIMAKGSLAVSLSPAVLVASMGIEHPLYVLLSKFSVFHIWEIVALGIGFSVCFSVAKQKGYMIAFLSAGLVALIHVLFALAQ